MLNTGQNPKDICKQTIHLFKKIFLLWKNDDKSTMHSILWRRQLGLDNYQQNIHFSCNLQFMIEFHLTVVLGLNSFEHEKKQSPVIFGYIIFSQKQMKK